MSSMRVSCPICGIAEDSQRIPFKCTDDMFGSTSAAKILAKEVSLRMRLMPLRCVSFLLAHSVGKSREVIRLIAVALRAFCRFLFLRGMITADHSVQYQRSRSGANTQFRHSSRPSNNAPSLLLLIVLQTADAVITQCFCYSLGSVCLPARLSL